MKIKDSIKQMILSEVPEMKFSKSKRIQKKYYKRYGMLYRSVNNTSYRGNSGRFICNLYYFGKNCDGVTFNDMKHYVNGMRLPYSGKKGIQDQNVKCAICGSLPTKEGYDPCLGKLSYVRAACCGHDIMEDAYIAFEDGYVIRGVSSRAELMGAYYEYINDFIGVD